jgi:ureidoacrylate peracid hydrolase
VDVYGLGYDEDGQAGNVADAYKKAVEENREIVIDHIKPAKVAAKRVSLPIVYLTNYLAPSTTENNEWRNMSLRTMNIDVLQAWSQPNDVLRHSKVIAPEEDDYLIKKQHYSGFYETHLESLLKELGARNLVTVGFDSRICLGTTVIDALYRNYRVIVLRDSVRTTEYVETREQGLANWMAIRFIESSVGYTSTSAAFIRACEKV